jgi:hypothetical protein
MSETIWAMTERLVGLECWGCSILPGSSVLNMALGRKVPDTSRGSWKLKPEERFTPEFALFIECTWRLDTVDSVVTVWSDYGEEFDGPMYKGISLLFGRRITSVKAVPPAWDLTVEFEGGYILKAFSGTSEFREEQDAWAVFHHEDGLLVSTGPKGRWNTDKNRPSNSW